MKKLSRRMLTMLLCVLFLVSASGGAFAVFAEESEDVCDTRAFGCTQHSLAELTTYVFEQIEGDARQHRKHIYIQIKCSNCLYTESTVESSTIIEDHVFETFTLIDEVSKLYEAYCRDCDYYVQANLTFE